LHLQHHFHYFLQELFLPSSDFLPAGKVLEAATIISTLGARHKILRTS
jgi:hypothetical protein